MRSFIAKFLPSLIALGFGALTVVTPVVQDALSRHPKAAGIIAAAYAIASHFLPSPLASSKSTATLLK